LLNPTGQRLAAASAPLDRARAKLGASMPAAQVEHTAAIERVTRAAVERDVALDAVAVAFADELAHSD